MTFVFAHFTVVVFWHIVFFTLTILSVFGKYWELVSWHIRGKKCKFGMLNINPFCLLTADHWHAVIPETIIDEIRTQSLRKC